MAFQEMYEKNGKNLNECGSKKEPLSVRCIFCTRQERVYTFKQLSKGNHIQINGEECRFNVGDKQLAPYNHHAIVKDINIMNMSDAVLTLIEFTSTSFDSNIKIRERQSVKTLENEDIYIIRYAHKTHSPDEIVSRAEAIAQQSKYSEQTTINYNLLSLNCEHFCHWCCIGKEESYQIGELFDFIELTFNAVTAYLSSIFLPGSSLYIKPLVVIACGIHIFCSENMCESCSKFRLEQYLIMQSVRHGLAGGIPDVVLSWIIKKLTNALCSPFKGKMENVMTMQQLREGDVVSFRNKVFIQDAVVTEVFPEKLDDKKGKLLVVYYKPSILGKSEIVEDTVDIDLRENTLRIHEYDPKSYTCYKPEIVVARARMKIGEKRFGLLSNRSSHFCHWAKVVKTVQEINVHEEQKRVEILYDRELSPEESYSGWRALECDHRAGRTHATKTLGRELARISEEIKQGDWIEFKLSWFWRWHEAVVTDVHYNEDTATKLTVTVVHCGESKEVTEDTFIFDLNEDDVRIRNPLYRFQKEDVVQRARARIGERKYNLLTHNSSHLSREIVELPRNTVVTDFEEVQPGDAIIFNYIHGSHMSYEEAGIVTKVILDASSDNKSATVSVVHYGHAESEAQRRIVEEGLAMNLDVDSVYKMNFVGVFKYPAQQIVKNSRDRIGETRFSRSGNTSWDFVHWASVIQYPVIVTEKVCSGTTSGIGDQLILLPKVVNPSGKFQVVTGQTWSDVHLGDIIEYKYYWINHWGIISQINEGKNYVKVIHYGANHLLAFRTVMEDILHINFKKEGLTIYRTDPRNCYTRKEIVKRAKRRLGEQDWGIRNRSWNLCLACVLKKDQSRPS